MEQLLKETMKRRQKYHEQSDGVEYVEIKGNLKRQLEENDEPKKMPNKKSKLPKKKRQAKYNSQVTCLICK